MSHWKTVWSLVNRCRDDGCTGMAAMISYSFFFTLPSVLILFVASVTLLPLENIGQRVTERFQRQGAGDGSIIQTTLDRTINEGRVWIFLLSLAGTLYVMSNGYAGLISSLNRIYGLKEKRSWLRVRLLALTMSSAAAVLVVAIFSLILLTPSIIEAMPGNWSSGLGALLFNLLRWPVIIGLAVLGLESAYRYAPGGGPRWRYITPGTVFGAVSWLIATRAFGFYVNNYGSYDRVYGALGTILVLLTWLWISALVILIGAEVNMTVKERRTTPDSESPV